LMDLPIRTSLRFSQHRLDKLEPAAWAAVERMVVRIWTRVERRVQMSMRR